MKLTYLVNNSTLKIIWLLAIFFYSILASYCVMHYDGFYGLRVLSIGSIAMMLLLVLLFVSLHYDFGTKPQVDWSNYRKDKMKLFLIAFLLVPIMVFDLSEKLSILVLNLILPGSPQYAPSEKLIFSTILFICSI